MIQAARTKHRRSCFNGVRLHAVIGYSFFLFPFSFERRNADPRRMLGGVALILKKD